jgi:hypothetical protein
MRVAAAVNCLYYSGFPTITREIPVIIGNRLNTSQLVETLSERTLIKIERTAGKRSFTVGAPNNDQTGRRLKLLHVDWQITWRLRIHLCLSTC